MQQAMRVWSVVLACAWLLPGAAPAVTVDAIGPRPQAVLDQAGLLDPQAEAEIAMIAARIRGERGADLVVVTLQSADGDEPHAFATRLSNRWQLGDRARDDGVLLLVAIEQRAVELILGDGIDDDAQVATAQRIVDARMLPSLRAGDPQAALLAGSRAIAADLFGLIALDADAQAVERATPAAPVTAPPAAPAAVPGRRSDDVPWVGFGVLAALGAFGVGVLLLLGRLLGRFRKRNCPRCNAPMQRLDEAVDDKHLTDGERTEERLRSVDYDVWACTACLHVEKRRHGRWFTSYARCPHCSVVALACTRRTLAAATRYSTGIDEVTTTCAHCGHRDIEQRTTPRLPTPSSSSSSRSWGGGSRGGGSSSGRGGSGRW